MRQPNTNISGWHWTQIEKDAVWEMATVVQGYDQNVFRRDKWGAWIRYYDHGNVVPGGYGWEIDHVLPVALGGNDDLDNLQPLHWLNNRRKGDHFPESVDDRAVGEY